MTSQQVADRMLEEHRADRIALARIAEIDAMFDMANGYGSWMAGCSIERRNLVNAINDRGSHSHLVPHKHRTNMKVD